MSKVGDSSSCRFGLLEHISCPAKRRKASLHRGSGPAATRRGVAAPADPVPGCPVGAEVSHGPDQLEDRAPRRRLSPLRATSPVGPRSRRFNLVLSGFCHGTRTLDWFEQSSMQRMPREAGDASLPGRRYFAP